jgi:hypothetical protein
MKISPNYKLYVDSILGLVRVTHICTSTEEANQDIINEECSVGVIAVTDGFMFLADMNDEGLKNGR